MKRSSGGCKFWPGCVLDFASLTGTFGTLNLPALLAGLSWNTSQLYTAEVLRVVAGVLGDCNNNGVVDSADYAAWHARFGNTSGSGAGVTVEPPVTANAVPEPAGGMLIAVVSCSLLRRKQFGPFACGKSVRGAR